MRRLRPPVLLVLCLLAALGGYYFPELTTTTKPAITAAKNLKQAETPQDVELQIPQAVIIGTFLRNGLQWCQDRQETAG